MKTAMLCTCSWPDPIANTGDWDERCPDCETCWTCCKCGWSAGEPPISEETIQALIAEEVVFRNRKQTVLLKSALAKTFAKRKKDAGD